MRTANEYMNEIGVWAEKNFPIHLPDYGLVEEIGEATHGILKRMQKIRKMDQDEVFFPHLKDAFSDIMIYLLHLCFLHNVPLSFGISTTSAKDTGWTDRRCISNALKNVAVLLDYSDIQTSDGVPSQSGLFHVPCQRLCNVMFNWSQLHEINLLEEIEKTWEKVSKREWHKNRDSAHECVS